MNVELLKKLLAVPTLSWHEQAMVDWLVHYVVNNIKGATVTVDPARNVYVSKGSARFSPCVAAHIDSVQPLRKVCIVEDSNRLIGFLGDKQVGIGADDKAGVFVCLNLLKRFNDIRAVFFATEEVGCQGAKKADARFFEDLAYVIEFDCPSHSMVSYTSSGVRLFANRGDFIQTALPALQKHGSVLWQRHPYTDVMAVRNRFPISCLNLSCGYYNWHAQDEYVHLPDVQKAIEQGVALVKVLDHVRYACPIDLSAESDEPLIAIGHLHVPDPSV
jgi:putative aminopeptidase FrvX